MISIYEKEGKTEEELLEELNTEEILYKIEEVPGKLFKGKKVKIIYAEKKDIKEYIKEYISNYSKALEKKINTEIREKDSVFNVMLVCDDNALIIGKDGKNLNAIQLLLHQAINKLTGMNIRINVDAANYKINKEKRLEQEIKNISQDVIKSKISVKLDPMNSYDRRIVHNVVGDYKELKTESFGEEPERYVVISYKED